MVRSRLASYFHLYVRTDVNLRIVLEFLSEVKDRNFVDGAGNGLLHSAARSPDPNIEIVRALIDAGADVNLANNLGFTPLHHAVIHRKVHMVDALLHSGADINAEDLMMKTALHYAVDNHNRLKRPVANQPEWLVIELLLHHKDVDINSMNAYGQTPLVWAILGKNPPIVKALLAKRADPNITTIYGESPLHLALSEREPCVPIVKLLLRHGADLHMLNRLNQTPIDYVVDGIRDERGENFARLFFRIVAFHINLNEDTIRSIGRDPELGEYLELCINEVRLLKSQVISGQLTIHDFVLGCYNEDQFQDPFLNIYRPLVDILMTDLCCIYLDEILAGIEKIELLHVLTNKISLRRIPAEIQLAEAIIFNANLYRALSRRQLLHLIMFFSDMPDALINAKAPF